MRLQRAGISKLAGVLDYLREKDVVCILLEPSNAFAPSPFFRRACNVRRKNVKCTLVQDPFHDIGGCCFYLCSRVGRWCENDDVEDDVFSSMEISEGAAEELSFIGCDGNENVVTEL